jgi:hypothetical protein
VRQLIDAEARANGGGNLQRIPPGDGFEAKALMLHLIAQLSADTDASVSDLS